MRYLSIVLLLLLSQPLMATGGVGSPAPNIFGRTLDNKLFRLSKVKGPIVINFFWVECAPCVKEMPELARLEKEHPNIKVISVHVEDEEQPVIKKFIERLTAHPKTIVAASPKVKDVYDIRALPHTVIINNGIIKAVFKGYTKKGFEKLRQRVKAL